MKIFKPYHILFTFLSIKFAKSRFFEKFSSEIQLARGQNVQQTTYFLYDDRFFVTKFEADKICNVEYGMDLGLVTNLEEFKHILQLLEASKSSFVSEVVDKQMANAWDKSQFWVNLQANKNRQFVYNTKLGSITFDNFWCENEPNNYQFPERLRARYPQYYSNQNEDCVVFGKSQRPTNLAQCPVAFGDSYFGFYDVPCDTFEKYDGRRKFFCEKRFIQIGDEGINFSDNFMPKKLPEMVTEVEINPVEYMTQIGQLSYFLLRSKSTLNNITDGANFCQIYGYKIAQISDVQTELKDPPLNGFPE